MTLISYIKNDANGYINYKGWLSKSERDSQNNNDTSSELKSHSENPFIDDTLPVSNDDTSIELKTHTKNNSIEEIIQ
ncbi:6886_t:CDS:2 [Entrophospora sp. SA101]|nr:6886_t:CDS:2 [Entrophospora sp. SA101]